MLARLDRVPRIARHPPAGRGFLLQWIEVLGLTAQQVEHRPSLEQAAHFAFAHEAREVGAEQRRENRIGFCVEQRLHDRSRIDLAERDRLFDEFDAARLQPDHLLLERGRRRLAILVVGVDDRPALLAELRGFGDEHRGLHVRGRPQPERVAVAVLPDDLVGQRLGGQKQHFPLLREVGDGEADVRRERTD